MTAQGHLVSPQRGKPGPGLGALPLALKLALLLPCLGILAWPWVAMGSVFWLLGAAAPEATWADQLKTWPPALLGLGYPLLLMANIRWARALWAVGRQAQAWLLAAWPWGLLALGAYLASLLLSLARS